MLRNNLLAILFTGLAIVFFVIIYLVVLGVLNLTFGIDLFAEENAGITYDLLISLYFCIVLGLYFAFCFFIGTFLQPQGTEIKNLLSVSSVLIGLVAYFVYAIYSNQIYGVEPIWIMSHFFVFTAISFCYGMAYKANERVQI